MSTIKAKISKILVPLDDSELAMKAADYVLLITKGLNTELLAIHVVRSEDALVATNSLIEDLESELNWRIDITKGQGRRRTVV